MGLSKEGEKEIKGMKHLEQNEMGEMKRDR